MDRRLLDVVSNHGTVDEVHGALMEIAVERANHDPTLPRDIYVDGSAFYATPWRSTTGGLCLSYEDFPLAYLEEPAKTNLINLMQDIGRSAFKQTIVENGDVIAGLVVAEAREGRNYFDRFR